MIKQINYIKADLDTVSTAALLTESLDNTKLIHLEHKASDNDLKDNSILCIECGGDGIVALNNFDHHQIESLPCATVQAYIKIGSPSQLLQFADHVSYIDTNTRLISTELHSIKTAFSISSLFSGMLYLYHDENKRFIKGYDLIKKILSSEELLNKVWDIPLISDDFKRYADAKITLQQDLENELCNAHTVQIARYKVMILHSELTGIHGLLKRNGADISIAINDTIHKISISFTPKTIHLTQKFSKFINKKEQGWGGHIDKGIVASPYKGSCLTENSLCKILSEAIEYQSSY